MSIHATNTLLMVNGPRISYACWEGETYIILVDGHPTGGSIATEREAKLICEWLQSTAKTIFGSYEGVKASILRSPNGAGRDTSKRSQTENTLSAPVICPCGELHGGSDGN